jgi:NAD(P)-dependent dehydrogenase (short-subunit alcohol dehydrogenase family)
MVRLNVVILTLFLAVSTATAAEHSPPSARKAVLVTGASTGIGRGIVERLAADGHFVYAGARKQSDLDALNKIKNVQAVRLDVTNQQDVDAALATISKAGHGLHGLVNNAGVATMAPVVGANQRELDLVMGVNTFGAYRVTQAFAPLVIAQKGRIVNIGSINGLVAGANVSAYSMSKHAIEAFTDSLAAEMQAHGVRVSVIEPGNYDSEIARNAVARMGQAAAPYAHLADRSNYKKPDEVAAAAAHALFDANPRPRYLVVPNEQEAQIVIGQQIAKLVQLNESQAYTYDRATLIKMLDKALARSRGQAQ